MTVVVLTLSDFLGWYDAVSSQGRLFLCDVAGLVGQKEAIPICRKKDELPEKRDQLALSEYLKENKDQLRPKQLAQLRQLEHFFIGRAFAELNAAAGLTGAAANDQLATTAQEAIQDIIEHGNAEERKAVAFIGDSAVGHGLNLLTKHAEAASLEAAAKWRQIGQLAYGVDTNRAIDAYKKVIEIEPDNADAYISLSELYRSSFASGRLDLALKASKRASEIAGDPVTASRAAIEEGWVLRHLGRLSEALNRRQAGLAQIEAAAAHSPRDLSLQNQRGVNLFRIGELQTELGDLMTASQTLDHSVEILQQVSSADPANAGWQRDLSVSYERIGNHEEALGDIAAAIAAYEKSLPIAQSLVDRFPGHPQFQSDVGITKRHLAKLRAKLD